MGLKIALTAVLVLAAALLIMGCAESSNTAFSEARSDSSSDADADADATADAKVKEIPLECCPEDSEPAQSAADMWEYILPWMEAYIGERAGDLPTVDNDVSSDDDPASDSDSESGVDIQLIFLNYAEAVERIDSDPDQLSDVEEWFYNQIDDLVVAPV